MSTELPDRFSYWKYDSFKDRIRAEGRPYNGTWRIHYQASDGEVTIRSVQISHFLTLQGTTHILGICKLRNEERAFRLGRIKHAYDLLTSVRIEHPLQYLSNEGNAKPKVTLQEAMEELLVAGRALVAAERSRQAALKTTKRRK